VPAARAQAHVAVASFVDRAEAETGQRIGIGRGLPGVTLPGALWRSGDPPESRDTVIAYPVDATWMSVARLQLVRGRLYSDTEANGNAPVAVVDERAARFFWPGADPIGQIVTDRQTRAPFSRSVIGVVRTVDVDFGRAADAGRANGRAFVPLAPDGFSPPWLLWRGPVSGQFVDRLRQAADLAAPGAKVRVTPLEPFERRLGEPRMLAWLMASLGLLALLLTIAGVYAVVSHVVSGRLAEIGIRMALGAPPARVRRMILVESLWPTVVGVVAGAGIAVWWTRALRGVLFGVDPTNPILVAAVAIAVVGVAQAACLRPARRAMRVDPVRVLQGD
jgi:hypothetical protein